MSGSEAGGGGLAEDGDEEVDLRRGSAGGGGDGREEGEGDEGEGGERIELTGNTPFERNNAVGSLSANAGRPNEPPSDTLVAPGASCEVTTTASRPASWRLAVAGVGATGDLGAAAEDSAPPPAGVLL